MIEIEEKSSESERRIVAAPMSDGFNNLQVIIDVECGRDEIVEWTWTETSAGRYVSGYQILHADNHAKNGPVGVGLQKNVKSYANAWQLAG